MKIVKHEDGFHYLDIDMEEIMSKEKFIEYLETIDADLMVLISKSDRSSITNCFPETFSEYNFYQGKREMLLELLEKMRNGEFDNE